MDKFKSKNGASVSEEVQWNIYELPFVQNKDYD